MKNLKLVLLLVTGFCLLTACEKNVHYWGDDSPGNTLKNGPETSLLITVPLKGDFTVVPEAMMPDETYEEYGFKLIMAGDGTMSHLGKMTTRMIFWAEGGPVGPYGYGSGTFVAANGDELYFEFDEGLIVWNEKENADFYLTRFNDPIQFSGGTGRFEGATGSMMSNAFVHYPDPNVEGDFWHTDFFSYGTLTMEK